jgi:Bacteriophage Gp15 protein.
MTFLLTSTFDDCFEYRGETIHLDLSFDNILRVFELFNDQMFSAYEKIEVALEMLVREHDLIEKVELEEKNALLLYIFREFLDMDLEKHSESGEKVFDFEQDAGIIFASFFRAYHIDLFEQHGKLHWKKFMQLFQNLDDKSKFKEIVNIRQMDLPKSDKHNAEYRKQIQKMKQIYALNKPTIRTVESIDKKWDAIAQSLKPRG